MFMAMVNKFVLFIFFFFIPIGIYSQRKEISQAKEWLKEGKEFAKAEESMRNLLKDSANRKNEKIWLVLFDAIKKQYDHGNEQLYLKNQYDTAVLFNATRRMFQVLESFDSVNIEPNKRGRIVLKYRKKHSAFLNTYRPNLYNGGLFFARKHDFKQAYDFFDTYIDCKNQPLFSGYDYENRDTIIPRAAYMAVYSGFKQNDAGKTLKYADLAMKDTAKQKFLYQYLAETYKQQADTAKYKSLLLTGFDKYPKSMYFFPRLFDLYYKSDDMRSALMLCDKALEVDSTNGVFLYAKSTVLLNIGRYDECINISDDLIARNDTLADAYLNAGLAYFNQAVRIDSNTLMSRKQKSRLRILYKSAMPYLERYRALAPDQKGKWGMPLYTIYLNLNMGKEFEEIDALLKTDDNK